MSPAAISVILPNYNGRELLEKNLPSLFSALEGIEHEVIVVDDASADDSIPFLSQHYPEVRVVVNPHNLGFSATCNRGVEAARQPLLCIVNTDVTFDPDYFHKALPHFDDPQLFAVKGDIVNYADSPENVVNIERSSRLYYKRGFLRFDQRVEPQPELFTGEIEGQFLLLGCCFVCDTQKMRELGGFDEVFSPFYWEDADLALRALRHGYREVYEPACRVYHQTSSTIASYRSNTRRRLVSMRNKFIFSWRHLHGAAQWLSHIGFTLLSLLGRWLILDWKYYLAFAKAIARTTQFRKG